MSSQDDTQDHVLIVGAGPVGLTLACLLRQQGVPFTIVDAKSGTVGDSRALGVHARTLEVMQTLGLSEAFVSLGRPTRYMMFHDRDRHLFSFDFRVLEQDTAYPYYLIIPQSETERLLHTWLSDNGGHVEWNTAVSGIEERDSCVTVAAAGKQRRFRYVIGCDGASSVVRSKLGIPFTGHTYESRFVLSEVRIAENRLRTDATHVILAPGATVAAIPMPNGAYRLVGPDTQSPDGADAESTLSFQTFSQFLSRNGVLSGATLYAPERVVSYRMQKRVAESFMTRRVLLAGDAAHIHSPAGGQGMNTGIQDAANLAWKLGLVWFGQAPSGLLESYGQERRGVAKATAEATERAMQIVGTRSVWRRTAMALAGAAYCRVGQPKKLIHAIAQLAIRYPSGNGEWSGRRVPWFRCETGGDVFDWFEGGRLLSLEIDTPNRPLPGLALRRIRLHDNRYFRRAQGWESDREVEHVAVDGHVLKALRGASRLVVRPDGYVLASERSRSGECERALQALTTAGALA